MIGWAIGVVVLACAGAPNPASTAPRVVAIGDVHGDLAATRAALRLAGLVDDADRWSGGTTIAVQLGDQLDRGDGERAILDWFARLQDQAADAGGRFVVLLGNHEVMNVLGDYRYVTPGGVAAFSDVPVPDEPRFARIRPEARGRVAAFLPGGTYAVRLSTHPVAAIIGDTAFVHGGLTAAHAAYGVDRFNAEAQAWMGGEGPQPGWATDDGSPLWTRAFSQDPADCAGLDEALKALGVSRMVVGHTPQRGGITAACEGKVWRVDVGMAAPYGGTPQALQIVGDAVEVLEHTTDAAR